MEECLSITTKLSNDIERINDDFEKAYYIDMLASQLTDFVKAITKESEIIKRAHSGESTDEYKVETVYDTRKSSELDYDALKSDMPEVYKRSLSIKASDAEKLIGKDRLKELVIQEVGWDNFEEIADVTITEARKNIPKALIPKYINEFYKETGLKVVKKQ